MKRFGKLTAVLLSAVLVAALGTGTAMALEGQNTTDASESTVSEDRMARLRRLNPHITEEQWAIVEEFEDLEANGLLSTGETQRTEDEHLISGSFTEAENSSDREEDVPENPEEKMARLRRNNPDITEEQWAIVEKIENPEANGLVKVGERQSVLDGYLIIDTIYEDTINSRAAEKKKYSAYTRILSDGTTNGELLVSIYMGAEFEFNSNTNFVDVIDGSISGFALKQVNSQYPRMLSPDNIGSYAENDHYPAAHTAFFAATMLWEYGGKPRTYNTYITVDSFGKQITPSLTDIAP